MSPRFQCGCEPTPAKGRQLAGTNLGTRRALTGLIALADALLVAPISAEPARDMRQLLSGALVAMVKDVSAFVRVVAGKHGEEQLGKLLGKTGVHEHMFMVCSRKRLLKGSALCQSVKNRHSGGGG